MPVIAIDDADDPRLSDYVGLSDPDLRHVDAVVADVVLGEGKMSGIDLIPALRSRRCVPRWCW